MKIDFTHKLTTIGGKELTYAVAACASCGRPHEEGLRTMRNACVDALTSVMTHDQGETGTSKVERYQLALRIHNEDMVNLTAEEIVIVKTRVGMVFGPLVVGQVWPMLDG